tara:strand:- start:350 stop:652 length:303 start_codon:yes stop_codon:yes gene_type:complete
MISDAARTSGDNVERDSSGKFKKGHKGLGGRPKGSIDKARVMREKIIDTVAKLDDEMRVDYLMQVAKTQPQAFLSLLGKCLPKDSTVEVDQETRVTIERL